VESNSNTQAPGVNTTHANSSLEIGSSSKEDSKFINPINKNRTISKLGILHQFSCLAAN
jgi:hypothetical protein